MTWQRVAVLFILVSGSIAAGAMNLRELASMLAGAAAGAAVPAGEGKHGNGENKLKLKPIKNDKDEDLP